MGKRPKRQKAEERRVGSQANNSRRDANLTFGFEHLQDASIMECKDHSFFTKFLDRLRKLSSMSWSQVNTDKRHGYGWEKIPTGMLNVDTNECRLITDDVKNLLCFRATGQNNVFLGLRVDDVFHVIYIEAKFDDIYKHKGK